MGKLLVIAGPTAVGKTDTALAVAKRVGGEIISADSVQVYRGLDIGAAKPTRQEREEVPHHLLDIVGPTENYTVARYQDDAARVIAEVQGRGKLPILVGGTGLYIRAVVQGYAFGEKGEDKALRDRLRREAEEHGPEALHRRLAVVDPVSAAKLHPNDLRRVIRALEFYESSCEPISRQERRTAGESVYDTQMFCLSMPRELLYRRIETRVDQMVAAGLVDEVRGLLNNGVPMDAKSMQSLGYKQLVAHLQGELSLEAAVALIKRDTRRYAKRQLTWFRREEHAVWLDLTQCGGKLEAAENISSFLAGYSWPN